ncbi:MAG: glycosyltransferase family 39 protein [Chitinophagales bacterium]
MATKSKKKELVKAKPNNVPQKKSNTTGTFDFWKRNWKPALVIFLLSFVLYGMCLNYEYVLDDRIVLSENNFVKKGFDGIYDIFSTESFTGYLGEQKDLVAGSRYRPLSIASFAIEHELFQENRTISHFLNILFYALTGLILFRVLSLFLNEDKKINTFLSVPFLTAALFILHPLHTEVVANIKGRDEIFAVLFSFIAIWFSFRQVKSGSIIWAVFAGIFFLLGLLGKENSIMLVPLIPFTFWFFEKTEFKKIVQLTIPYIIAVFIFLVMRTKAIGFFFSAGKEITEIMNNPFYGVSFADKSATIFYTLGLYMKLLFFPHPLTYDYYPYHIPIIHWTDVRALLPLFIYIFLIALAILGLRKKSLYSWSIIFYLTTLFITSNFVFPVGTFMNERFLYMPSIAFCLILAWLTTYKLPQILGEAGRKIGFAVLLVFAGGFTIKTLTRVPEWKNQEILDFAALKVSKNSARANSFCGYFYYFKAVGEKDPAKQKELYEKALPLVNRALEIYPKYSDAVTAKAGVVSGFYQQDGKLDKLLDAFKELLSHRQVDFIYQYMEYLNVKLTNAGERNQLIKFYHETGYEMFAIKDKDFEAAIKYLELGRKSDLSNVQLIQDLTVTYFEKGDFKKCRSMAEEGLKINPSDSICRNYLIKVNPDIKMSN